MSKVKSRRVSPPTRLIAILAVALVLICSALPSCNVTRTITNESKYLQRGDTSVVIQTKTIEKYDAKKQSL